MRVAPDRSDYSEHVGVALSQNLHFQSTATITLYSADGLFSVQEHRDDIADTPEVAKSDDDLTSLTWLQNRNLLNGVCDEQNSNAKMNADTNKSVMATESASNTMSSYLVSKEMPTEPLVPDPQVPKDPKPPFSFSCLIFMAIESSERKALPVKDIYVWIINHFPYYRTAPTGWKNSVRHNLSLNRCFKKVDKLPNLGKGSLWMVEQSYRTSLIQGLKKTPNEYHSLVQEVIKSSDTAKSSEMILDNNCEENNFAYEMTETKCSGSSNESYDSIHSPFPHIYFSDRRIGETLEDVDAAAAMLALKHGTCAFDVISDRTISDYQPSANIDGFENQDIKPFFTSCPSEDHNYIHDCASSNMTTLKNDFVDRTEEIITSNYMMDSKDDAEERRKIVEGADALMNLAGIKNYYNTRKRSSFGAEEKYSHYNKKLRVVGIESYKNGCEQSVIKNYPDSEIASSSEVSSSSGSGYSVSNNGMSPNGNDCVEVDGNDVDDIRMKFYKKIPSRRSRRQSTTYKEGKYCLK